MEAAVEALLKQREEETPRHDKRHETEDEEKLGQKGKTPRKEAKRAKASSVASKLEASLKKATGQCSELKEIHVKT